MIFLLSSFPESTRFHLKTSAMCKNIMSEIIEKSISRLSYSTKFYHLKRY